MSKRFPILSATSATSSPESTATQWRSLDDLESKGVSEAILDRESPQSMREADAADGVSRRGFMGWAGFTVAGLSSTLSGCIRKPTEHILPFGRRPEDLIPGVPSYYATVARVGGEVLGLVVESQEGRPTKVEGNPLHPNSRGKAGALAQASVLDLYDADRPRVPATKGAESTWEALWGAVDGALASSGAALLLEDSSSPTVQRLVAQLRQANPSAGVYSYSAASRTQSTSGLALAGLSGVALRPAFDKAAVIASFDCDFLGVEGETTRNSGRFADGRRVASTDDSMSRLYAIEPVFSLTGSMADHRLRVPGLSVGRVLEAVAARVFAGGVAAPPGSSSLTSRLRSDLAALTLLGSDCSAGAGGEEGMVAWVDALAKDLLDHRGTGLVVVGSSQPASVHALAHLLNVALGNVGTTLHLVPTSQLSAGGIGDLAADIAAGKVQTLVMVGGNPAYDAPADLDFAGKLASVATTIHLSDDVNETSSQSTWHAPRAHYLECWGDLQALDGTTAIQQPLIAPLHGAVADVEFVSRAIGGGATSAHDLVRATWSASPLAGADFEQSWQTWLHDGVVKGTTSAAVQPSSVPVMMSDADSEESGANGSGGASASYAWAGLAAAWSGAEVVAPTLEALEVAFRLDGTVYDGRYANNAWLQELPDPMTKLCWDNAALISPRTAECKKLATGDMASLSLGDRSLELPVFVLPGMADNVVVLPLGYGRSVVGAVGEGCGFNTYALRTAETMHFASGATLTSRDSTYELATTQNYGRLDPKVKTPFGEVAYPRRNAVRESSLKDFKAHPDFVQAEEVMPAPKLKSLFVQPNETAGQQWGMSIDLNVCTGCNACTVACQAENNIMVVGKERVLKGREMSWIRLDRYFTGDLDNPEAVVQPMACAHCETAPCEQVCPVAATAHSPDGLNDIAYNRCIGTRYCANNCPFKVRRFNYFNYSKENAETTPLGGMQRNPDVSVRFRGVIEKCTYCVQRVNSAKIEAKRDGDGVVEDGRLVSACAQACPTDAIVFGDISDSKSAVSVAKAQPRNYAMLAELNIHPRTTYLAKLRNRNPDIELPAAAIINHGGAHGAHGHGGDGHGAEGHGSGSDHHGEAKGHEAHGEGAH